MTKRVEVTGENYGDLLIQGLEEAVAVKEGRLEPPQVSRRKITARKVEVTPPPKYSRARITRVRSGLGVSQAVFASMLNVSKGTVSAWEQGAREPEGSTRRLLELAEYQPDVFIRSVSSRSNKPGRETSVGRKKSDSARTDSSKVRNRK